MGDNYLIQNLNLWTNYYFIKSIKEFQPEIGSQIIYYLGYFFWNVVWIRQSWFQIYFKLKTIVFKIVVK